MEKLERRSLCNRMLACVCENGRFKGQLITKLTENFVLRRREHSITGTFSSQKDRCKQNAWPASYGFKWNSSDDGKSLKECNDNFVTTITNATI